MKKIIYLLILCLAVLCFFSSCGAFDPKPLESTYRHYGYIIYKDPDRGGKTFRAERCLLSLYKDGKYTIDLINSGTWERDGADPNKIILTPSDTKLYSRIELAYDPKYYELEPISTESVYDGFEVSGMFRYTSPL